MSTKADVDKRYLELEVKRLEHLSLYNRYLAEVSKVPYSPTRTAEARKAYEEHDYSHWRAFAEIVNLVNARTDW